MSHDAVSKEFGKSSAVVTLALSIGLTVRSGRQAVWPVLNWHGAGVGSQQESLMAATCGKLTQTERMATHGC